ncbi:hypothetical protein GCM10014719_29500 [Planomonospora parontospora subsp. antibiotica]|nr:hypothetical protein GCM10014719_29500 [Planomonospora parontospora subsp. antibiotica]GII16050.1 hypothetical protein Ppa05_27760 [Planomonospora parontospora subsp. antibiotica]
MIVLNMRVRAGLTGPRRTGFAAFNFLIKPTFPGPSVGGRPAGAPSGGSSLPLRAH